MVVSNLRKILFYLCALCLQPLNIAQAHNFFGDTQPLLNGIAHPFLTISHLLLIISLGLVLFSQKKPEQFLGVFLITLLGGFLGQWFLSGVPFELGFSLLLILWGVVVALHYLMSFRILILPLAVSGLIIGLDTVSESQDVIMNLVFYLGSIFGVVAFFSYVLILKDFIKQEWHWVIIRTLGGWMFAVGLMMLAFYFSV